jgi:hypothetical protein
MEIITLIVSAILVVLGGLVAIFNNWILVQQLRGRHSPSVVPLLGGIFLMVGLFLFPYYDFSWWAALALVVDYGCAPYLLFVVTYLTIESYKTSKLNLMRQLNFEEKEKSIEIKLFKKSIATIVFKIGSTTVSRACSWEKEAEDIVAIDCGDSSYKLHLEPNGAKLMSEKVNDRTYSLEGLAFNSEMKG